MLKDFFFTWILPTVIYRDRRVERHSNMYKPLAISNVYYCLIILGDEVEFKGTKSERESVANRLINAPGQRRLDI